MPLRLRSRLRFDKAYDKVRVPSAFLVDVSAFEMMQDRMAILEGIARGERAVLEGRTLTHAEARERLGRWLA